MGKMLLFGSAASWLMNILYTICLFIDGIIYYFVALNYKVFYVVSRVNLFGDSELKQITDRVYMVLGVFMLFVFAYNILTLIINPDNLGGKDEKSLGGLAKNMIISIVILTLLPTGFNYLHKIQNSVLESNVIGNMILGGWSNSEEDYSISEAGTTTALLILSAFYHPVVGGEEVTPAQCSQMIADGEQGPKDICTQYMGAYIQAQELMKIRAFTLNDVLIDGIYNGEMEYLPIISAIAGFFAAYLFLSFSMDVGVRMVKFAFLQLIAPVPVILRITKPKGGTFSRWVGEMTNTYFAIFIRLAFIFFCMYVISLVPTVLANLWTGTDGSLSAVPTGIVVVLANVIIILGILSFAKTGPKMFEDLFKIEHLDISIKKKLGENEYAMRAITAGRAMGRSAIQGASNGGGFVGGLGGAVLGAKHGWKQGGSVKDISQLKGAVKKAQGEAEVEKDQLVSKAKGFATDPAGTIQGKWQDYKDGLTGHSGQYWQKHYEAYDSIDKNRSNIVDLVGGFSGKDATGTVNLDVKKAKEARDKLNIADYLSGDKDEAIRSNLGLAPGTAVTDAMRQAEYQRVYTTLDTEFKDQRRMAYESIMTNPDYAVHRDNMMENFDKMLENMKDNSDLVGDKLDLFIDKWNSTAPAGLAVAHGDYEQLVSHLKNDANADITAKVMAGIAPTFSQLKNQASVNRVEADKPKS